MCCHVVTSRLNKPQQLEPPITSNMRNLGPGKITCSGNWKRVQNSFFLLRFWNFCWDSFTVPSALYLQQFGTLESVILHGICYILAWSLCILHGICYIWPCSPSILHGICHILAFQPLICMVFATFWCFKRSCGSLGGSLGFYLGFL